VPLQQCQILDNTETNSRACTDARLHGLHNYCTYPVTRTEPTTIVLDCSD